jgi:hypothetical protein
MGTEWNKPIIPPSDSAIPAGNLGAHGNVPNPALGDTERRGWFHRACGFCRHLSRTSLIEVLERASSHGPMTSSQGSPSYRSISFGQDIHAARL